MILTVKLIKTLLVSIISFTMLLWSVNISSVLASTEGMLVSSDNSILKIYPQPNQELPEIGTASVGDKIIVLEQASNNENEVWDRIRLVNYKNIEGWIADSYVVIEKPQNNVLNNLSDPYDPSNYYQVNQLEFENKK